MNIRYSNIRILTYDFTIDFKITVPKVCLCLYNSPITSFRQVQLISCACDYAAAVAYNVSFPLLIMWEYLYRNRPI
jgi:hypothetical protein